MKTTRSPHRSWNAKRFRENGNRYEFTFVGERIKSVCFGRDVKLVMDDEFQTSVEFWMPFTVFQHGQQQVYEPHQTATLVPLLSLLERTLLKPSVTPMGFLS